MYTIDRPEILLLAVRPNISFFLVTYGDKDEVLARLGWHVAPRVSVYLDSSACGFFIRSVLLYFVCPFVPQVRFRSSSWRTLQPRKRRVQKWCIPLKKLYPTSMLGSQNLKRGVTILANVIATSGVICALTIRARIGP